MGTAGRSARLPAAGAVPDARRAHGAERPDDADPDHPRRRAATRGDLAHCEDDASTTREGRPDAHRPHTRLPAWRVVARHRRSTIAFTALAVSSAAGSAVADVAAAGAGAVFRRSRRPASPTPARARCGCTRLDANTIRVQVLGRPGVPGGTTSAALSLTVTATTGTGYATAWPSGSADAGHIERSTGPAGRRGRTARSSRSGRRCDRRVRVVPREVIVDMTGAFVDGPGAVAGGRFTRRDPSPPARHPRRPRRSHPASAVTVALPAGVPRMPPRSAVTITVTDSTGWGYVVAYPAGSARPGSSVVNTDQRGQTRAATAIVPVSAGGLDAVPRRVGARPRRRLRLVQRAEQPCRHHGDVRPQSAAARVGHPRPSCAGVGGRHDGDPPDHRGGGAAVGRAAQRRRSCST